MIHPTLVTALFLCAGSALAQRPPKEPLVVHEWGTFTSMQGSDGFDLEGLHWEEESLPGFVHSLTRFREQAESQPEMQRKLARPVRQVTQKMETPVLYFHSSTPRRVRVQVTFQRGLMTQWYPVAETMWPWPAALQLKPGEVLDIRKVNQSMLTWHIDLIPFAKGIPPGIPTVPHDDPWQFAREVASASVRTVPPKKSKAPPQTERFLFYRGLGSFQVPIQVRAKAGGQATFTNGESNLVPFALAMEVTQRGGRLTKLGAVAPREGVAFDLGDMELQDMGAFVSRVHGLVVKALLETGLTTDEATAMVRTWSRQWFRSPGNRVIYFLPRARVDQVLPLRITPPADKVVRVLVGRLEYLTPEVEAKVATALSRRDAADPAVRARARQTLAELGRFQEPKVRGALRRTTDPKARQGGAEVLELLRAGATQADPAPRTPPSFRR